uniref:Uncharacterized protein n=1 Tax=Phytophthora fragariae TaxID=53985 RepID=A0A6A3DZK2_9STRA|nr:hypothetical protein PF009_g23164 [Phytophthora fragariae]
MEPALLARNSLWLNAFFQKRRMATSAPSPKAKSLVKNTGTRRPTWIRVTPSAAAAPSASAPRWTRIRATRTRHRWPHPATQAARRHDTLPSQRPRIRAYRPLVLWRRRRDARGRPRQRQRLRQPAAGHSRKRAHRRPSSAPARVL